MKLSSGTRPKKHSLLRIGLTLLVYLNVLVVCAQAWPRHPKTGKIVFQGLLPWPVGVVTDSARRVLIGKWYLQKLTTSNALVVSERAAPPYTYGGWPAYMHLQHIELPGLLVQLRYTVDLAVNKAGLRYRFTDFSCLRTEGREVDNGPIVPLEDLVATPHRPVAGQASLTLFRRRLIEATTHW